MNPQVDRYLAKATKWKAEMEKLRAIMLDTPLTEELKWGKPCYSFNGGNVVIIQAFKDTCALLFCKGALLNDPRAILQKPGENTQSARRILFTDIKEITRLAKVIKAYVLAAIDVEQAGLEVEYRKSTDLVFPEEFQQRLKADPALKKAFTALTPGRQRGYHMHFSSAKQPKTRESRIDKCVPLILAGKGLQD